MNIQLLILFLVFFFIAFRRFGNINIKIWQSMGAGALLSIITGGISPVEAIAAIHAGVMVFLFSMFLIGAALEESGLLHIFSQYFFCRFQKTGSLVFCTLFFFAPASAILMNDTIAIIGTPLVIAMATRQKAKTELFLLALCFAITIGSVPSPFGNPQNLLIAIEGKIANPFIFFWEQLSLPTLINLLLAFLVLRILYRKEFSKTADTADIQITPDFNPGLRPWVLASAIILITLILLKIISFFQGYLMPLNLEIIAATAALPLLLCPQRIRLIRQVDWHTLIFFAAMFILMQSVWNSGFFQQLINRIPPEELISKPAITTVSITLSQLISNVPLVALYLPVLQLSGIEENGLALLAAASTIAGNLLIMGAASNVIVIQNAEKRCGATISFLEFAVAGIPLTILNAIVYYIFL